MCWHGPLHDKKFGKEFSKGCRRESGKKWAEKKCALPNIERII